MSDNHGLVLDRFYAAVTGFMTSVDSASALDRDAFLSKVGRSLAELYCSALDLPAVEPESETADDTPFPTDEWKKQYLSLREKIGPLDAYWLVFDSAEKEEPVQGSLAGDISEIYYDLRQDLQLREKGIPRADMLWEIHSSFREHWGRHAIAALKTIYDLHLG